MTQLDDLSINTLSFLSIDMVEKAKSGHPGTPMGAAVMAYTLWTRHLRHHPANPKWADRDRFILSPGHASALLYSLLHLTGTICHWRSCSGSGSGAAKLQGIPSTVTRRASR